MTVISNFNIVSIEGNIGSGKSTLLENLKQTYCNNTNVIFLKEPVDDWETIKDEDGNTMLKKFYEDQNKYSFAFQMMAYISRLKILKDAVKMIENKKDEKFVIITERCLYTDKYVFAKMLYDQGKIENVCFQIYSKWFEEFANDYPISHSIYVNTDPIICYNRIHKRARNGEEVMPQSYLNDCHKYHESFLKIIETRKLILDGNVDIYENRDCLNNWLNMIDLFIK
jgi:deoxyguanosine kinase